MQKPNSNKNILIVIALIVVGAGFYFYMSGTPAETDPSLVAVETTSDAGVTASRVLVLLNQINSLKIDSTFFTSQTYSSLVDHTVPIYEQPVGKSNPFFNPSARSGAAR